MAKYEFLHLARMEKSGLGVMIAGKMTDVFFKKGRFITEDEVLADAIKKHPSFTADNPKERVILLSVSEINKPAPQAEEAVPAPQVAEEDTASAPAPVPEIIDYHTLTKAKLLKMGKDLGIHVHSDDNKDQIIAAIKEFKESANG